MGEEVLAADFNAYVQRQVVPTFANAAARDAAITTPAAGMLCVLTDTGTLQQYTVQAPTPGWYKPWRTAWGLVAQGATNDLTVVGSAQFIMPAQSINFPGRQLEVSFSVILHQQSTVGTVNLTFQRGAFIEMPGYWSLGPNYRIRATLRGLYAGENGTVGVICSDDAGTALASWGRWTIIDVGPV